MITLEPATRPAPRMQPPDGHSAALLRHVHPPDWTNPQPAGRYHLVVIGAGTAGLVTAAGSAGLGAEVALMDRELMGGAQELGLPRQRVCPRIAHGHSGSSPIPLRRRASYD